MNDKQIRFLTLVEAHVREIASLYILQAGIASVNIGFSSLDFAWKLIVMGSDPAEATKVLVPHLLELAAKYEPEAPC